MRPTVFAVVITTALLSASSVFANPVILGDAAPIAGAPTDLVALVAYDLDRDGDEDLIACGPSGIVVLTNERAGSWAVGELLVGGVSVGACSSLDVPVPVTPGGDLLLAWDRGVLARDDAGVWRAVFDGSAASATTVGDGDRDGVAELYACGADGRIAQHLWTGATFGAGTDRFGTDDLPCRDLQVATVFADGVPRLVASSSSIFGSLDAYDIRTGSAVRSGAVPHAAFLTADVDLDSDLDIVTFGGGVGAVFYRAGGRTLDYLEIPEAGTDVFLTAGDFDADDRPELLAVRSARDIELLTREDDRWHVEVVRDTAPGDVTAVVATDVGPDGDLDLVVAHAAGITVYENRSVVAFEDFEPEPFAQIDREYGAVIVPIDADRDGDDELALTSPRRAGVWLYDETEAGWTATRIDATRSITNPGAAGDLDGDGDLDLVGCGGVNLWRMLNDGDPDWQATNLAPFVDGIVTLADVDGDSDLDIVAAQPVPGRVILLLNDGSGTFSVATEIATSDSLVSVQPIDIDRDGDVDIALAGVWGDGEGIAWLENGNGWTRHLVAEREVGAAVFGDVDRDGRVEAIAAGAGLATRVLDAADDPTAVWTPSPSGTGASETLFQSPSFTTRTVPAVVGSRSSTVEAFRLDVDPSGTGGVAQLTAVSRPTSGAVMFRRSNGERAIAASHADVVRLYAWAPVSAVGGGNVIDAPGRVVPGLEVLLFVRQTVGPFSSDRETPVALRAVGLRGEIGGEAVAPADLAAALRIRVDRYIDVDGARVDVDAFDVEVIETASGAAFLLPVLPSAELDTLVFMDAYVRFDGDVLYDRPVTELALTWVEDGTGYSASTFESPVTRFGFVERGTGTFGVGNSVIAVDEVVVEVDRGATIDIELEAALTDPDGDPVEVVRIVGDPRLGTAELAGDTTITYRAGAVAGDDGFTYVATDGINEVLGFVAVTVGAFLRPIAESQWLSTTRGQPLAFQLTSVAPATVVYTLETPPEHGTLAWEGGDVSAGLGTYTPDPGFVGRDQFRFVASMTGGDSDPATVTIDVLRPAPDDGDGDGTPETVDNCPGVANADQRDSDRDGEGDACDDDDDGDGILDAVDRCPLALDDGVDTDDDGFGDACDDDDDDDGIADDEDLCPLVADPDQEDLDEDFEGDACDDDLDGDLVPNDDDNCPRVANRAQLDHDEDETGDACDDDDDGDGIADDLDVCPFDADPDQRDTDDDGVGDVCEGDRDGDGALTDEDCDDLDPLGRFLTTYCADADEDGFGDSDDCAEVCSDLAPVGYVEDANDNCPTTFNPDQADADDDGRGDACDGDDPGGDAGTDAGSDAGTDAGSDAGTDAGSDAGMDAGSDARTDAGGDAGTDAGSDAGTDAESDVGSDAGPDTAGDASGDDAEPDASHDVFDDADAPDDAAGESDANGTGGRGCSAAGSAPDGAGLLLLGAALVLSRRRRRRRSGFAVAGLALSFAACAPDVAAPDADPAEAPADEPGAHRDAPPKDAAEIPVPTIHIEPAAPRTTDALTVVIDNAAAYDDTVALTAAWSVDDEVRGAGTVIDASATGAGETWRVVVTAMQEDGDFVRAMASVAIANTSPAVEAARLTPSAPTRGDALRCEAEGWADADGDPEQVAVRWLAVGGAAPRVLTGDSLEREAWDLNPGTEVVCELTPYDASAVGDAVTSSTATVVNRAPSVAGVSVEGEAAPGALLRCEANGVDDPDGDIVWLDYLWSIDGVPMADVDTAWWIADRVGAIGCEVTPHDGWEPGLTVVTDAPLEVLNATPSVHAVHLAGGSACAPWTCRVEGVPGGTTPVYRWTIAGEVVDVVGDTLEAGAVEAGASVLCEVFAWDGVTRDADDEPAFGPGVRSEERIAENVGEARATLRDHARPGDVLRCDVSAASACVAPDVSSFVWTVNGGVIYGADDVSFNTLGLSRGDRVRCIANLEGGPAVTSGVLELSAPGYRLLGTRAGGFLGRGLAVAEDLDGDQYNEIVAGSPGFDNGPGTDAGALFVVNGRDDLNEQELEPTLNPGYTVIRGTAGGYGLSNSICNEFTTYEGGCPQVDPGGTTDAFIRGPEGGGLGFSAGYAGDIDGDGVGDVLAGAPWQTVEALWQGRAFVLSGAAMSPSVAVEAASGELGSGYVLDGECGRRPELDDLLALSERDAGANGDLAGYSVAGIGDVNGDGLGDLAVGAVNSGFDDEGVVYVVYGRADGRRVSARDIIERGCGEDRRDIAGDGTAGFAIVGQGGGAGDALWGLFIDTAGDFDGDGYDDIVVHPGGLAGTRTYVVRGGPSRQNVYLETATLPDVIEIEGGSFGFTSGAFYGRLAAGRPAGGGGDVNGDGYDDLVFNAWTVDEGTGVSVLFGGPLPESALHLDEASSGARGWATAVLTGFETGTGEATVIDDMNGDGLDDILIGAPNDRSDRGTGLVIFGSEAAPGVRNADLEAGDGGFVLAGDAPGDQLGAAVAGGDINGDGLGDVLVGAPFAANGELDDAGVVVVEYGRDFGGLVDGFGGRSADTLLGTRADDRLVGGLGDDTLLGGGGADVLYGGAGDDRIEIGDLAVRRIRGGAGEDTLVLAASCPDPDLAVFGRRVSDIERLELNGQELTLAARDILRLSRTSNRLIVQGSSGAIAVSGDDPWDDAGEVAVDGVTYATLVAGWAELWLDRRIETTIPPSFITRAFEVPEDAEPGSVVFRLDVVDADGDDDALTFRLEGDAAGFAIDADTGAVTYVGPRELDYETTARTIPLRVVATDEDGLERAADLTVHVTDVNEAPFFSSPVLTVNVLEGVPDDEVLVPMSAVDVDADDVVTYEVVSDPDALFEVDAETGDVSLRAGAGLDYEAATSHAVTVAATDSGGLRAEAEITIAVADRTRLAREVEHVFTERYRSLTEDREANDVGIFDDEYLPIGDAFESCMEWDALGGLETLNYVFAVPQLYVDLFGSDVVRFDITSAGGGSMCSAFRFGRSTGERNLDLPATVEFEYPDEVTLGEPFEFGTTLTPDFERALLWGETPELFVDFEFSWRGFWIHFSACYELSVDDIFGSSDDERACQTFIDIPRGGEQLSLSDVWGYEALPYAIVPDATGRFVTERPLRADDHPLVLDRRGFFERMWSRYALPVREGTYWVGEPPRMEVYFLAVRPEMGAGIDGQWDIDAELSGWTGVLTLESGRSIAFEAGVPLTMALLPADDADDDGLVSFELALAPVVAMDVDERRTSTFFWQFRMGELRSWLLDEAGQRIQPPYTFGPVIDAGCGGAGLCLNAIEDTRFEFDAGTRPLRLNGAFDLAAGPG